MEAEDGQSSASKMNAAGARPQPTNGSSNVQPGRLDIDTNETKGGSATFLDENPTISGKPYPARPDTIKFVQMPKTTTNHTYRVFTNMPPDPSYRIDLNTLDQLNFHEKLYSLLVALTNEQLRPIDWCHGGRAFCIRDVEKLLRAQHLQRYFGSNSIHRFRKQLVCYGYKQLTRNPAVYGADCYYSEVSCGSQASILLRTYRYILLLPLF